MADDSFKKPKKIEYVPEDQDPFDPAQTEDKPLEQEFAEQDDTSSTAAIVVDEYTRTIEFMKFIEELLREASKVEVEIDPEDDPEVWMAMNRIFSNPSPKMNQDSYFQVIDALEAIERIEQIEDNPPEFDEEFLENLPDSQEVDEGEITEDDFQISAVDEIEEKAKITRASAFRDPPPPPPPPKPPVEHPWLRRWRRYYRKVNVLGRPYKVQWLRNRWWRDRYDRWRRR